MISQDGWWNFTFSFPLYCLRLNSLWSHSVAALSTLTSCSALPHLLKLSKLCWHLGSGRSNFHCTLCLPPTLVALFNMRKIRFLLNMLHFPHRWSSLLWNILLTGLHLSHYVCYLPCPSIFHRCPFGYLILQALTLSHRYLSYLQRCNSIIAKVLSLIATILTAHTVVPKVDV